MVRRGPSSRQAIFIRRAMRKGRLKTLRKSSIFAKNYLKNGNAPKLIRANLYICEGKISY